jgi:hypothetical protein
MLAISTLLPPGSKGSIFRGRKHWGFAAVFVGRRLVRRLISGNHFALEVDNLCGPHRSKPTPQLHLALCGGLRNNVEMVIQTSAELSRFCDRIAKSRVIAIDTEFESESRYYSAAATLQVASDAAIALIDLLAVSEISALQRIISNVEITKVLHAGSHLAHTLDISNHGVRLGGCRGEMKVGDKIVIQYRHKQAQFQIAWIAAHEGSLEKQIGAECLEPGKQVWGAQFPQQADEYEEKE